MSKPDFKAMYYLMAGRMAVAIDTMAVAVDGLKATTGALEILTKNLQEAQSAAEEIYLNSEDDDCIDTKEAES